MVSEPLPRDLSSEIASAGSHSSEIPPAAGSEITFALRDPPLDSSAGGIPAGRRDQWGFALSEPYAGIYSTTCDACIYGDPAACAAPAAAGDAGTPLSVGAAVSSIPSGGIPSGGIPSGGIPSGGIPAGGIPAGGISKAALDQMSTDELKDVMLKLRPLDRLLPPSPPHAPHPTFPPPPPPRPPPSPLPPPPHAPPPSPPPVLGCRLGARYYTQSDEDGDTYGIVQLRQWQVSDGDRIHAPPSA